MLRCCWGRLGEGWGGVGHVTLRVRLHWTDATLLMGEGWGGVGHVTLHVHVGLGAKSRQCEPERILGTLGTAAAGGVILSELGEKKQVLA